MKSTSFSSTRDTWNVSPFHQEGKNGQSQSPPNYGLDFVDHPSATIQRVEDMGQQPVADASFQSQQPPNNTGLPDELKAGVENLSGHSMDDVKVHYNSPKPAQLQALAYAQSTDIHIAPGQEQHLPHEAWHVVQQKQGRVKPARQMKGQVNINDDVGLEKEADVMGAKALTYRPPAFFIKEKPPVASISNALIQPKSIGSNVIQCVFPNTNAEWKDQLEGMTDKAISTLTAEEWRDVIWYLSGGETLKYKVENEDGKIYVNNIPYTPTELQQLIEGGEQLLTDLFRALGKADDTSSQESANQAEPAAASAAALAVPSTVVDGNRRLFQKELWKIFERVLGDNQLTENQRRSLQQEVGIISGAIRNTERKDEQLESFYNQAKERFEAQIQAKLNEVEAFLSSVKENTALADAWFNKNKKAIKARPNQSDWIEQYAGEAKQQILKGVCYGASIYWLWALARDEKLTPERALAELTAQGFEEVVGLQLASSSREDKQLRSLPEVEKERWGGLEESFSIDGEIGNYTALTTFLRRLLSEIKENEQRNYVLSLTELTKETGHATALRIVKTKKNKVTLSFLDVNSVLITKEIENKEGQWMVGDFITAIGEYLEFTYKGRYKKWTLEDIRFTTTAHPKEINF